MYIAVTSWMLSTCSSATLSTDEGKLAWAHMSKFLLLREEEKGNNI